MNKDDYEIIQYNYQYYLGILAQPTPFLWQKANRTTYIAASYVKYIEATGAQVVPIRLKLQKKI